MSKTGRSGSDGLLHVYVASVIVGGAFVATVLATRAARADSASFTGPYPVAFGILVAFLLAAELRPLKWLRRQEGGEVTVSWSFSFALLLIATPAAAVMALLVACLAGDLSHRKPLVRALFNAGQVTLSLAAGAVVLEAFGQRDQLLGSHGPSLEWLPVVVAAAGTIFVLNGVFTCVVLALHQKVPVLRTVREGVWMNVSIDGMLLALGPVFVVVARFSLLLLPLALITAWAVYRSAQLALARQHEATHDQLTGLPNRRLFEDLVEAAILDAEHRQHALAVMILDLDGFKAVNDRLGHHIGDLVLQQLGHRFEEAGRSTDVVARLGGDEFAILARPVANETEAAGVAGNLLHLLRQPCIVQGLPVSLDASLGIAMFPEQGTDFSTLLRQADVAMYGAKQANVGIHVYSNDRDRHSHGRLGLLAELPAALAAGELFLNYQPKVSMASGELVGLEALVRWRHPRLGVVPPRDFIPLAEHTELIEPFTEFVLRRALLQCARWRAEGLELQVAVNASARNLHDLAFPELVGRVLDKAGMPASALEIEITENTVMEDPVRTLAVATELRAMGIQLSIDDFGTGYSSLATLKDLPVNAIKIDRTFVADITSDRGGAIVQAIIELAHTLGLETVAEGVERQEVWDRLERLGCDIAQGFLTGRPVLADAISRAARDRDRALAIAR